MVWSVYAKKSHSVPRSETITTFRVVHIIRPSHHLTTGKINGFQKIHQKEKSFPRGARQEIALHLITQVYFFPHAVKVRFAFHLDGLAVVPPENHFISDFTRVFTRDFTRCEVFTKNPKQTKHLPHTFRLTLESSLKIPFSFSLSIPLRANGQNSSISARFHNCPFFV